MKIVPRETQLREMDAPEVIALLKSKGAPEGTKRYEFGKAEVLLVPPHETRGWWISMYRPDRPITQTELIHVGSQLIPKGTKMSGRIEPNKMDDGNYHAMMYEEVEKNGDPPYLQVVK